MKWIVSQIGRRQDYAIARELDLKGNLARLITDCWAGGFRTFASCLPFGVSDIANRFHPDIAPAKVHSFNCRAIAAELGRRIHRRRRNWQEAMEAELTISIAFDKRVAGLLDSVVAAEHAQALFTFSSGGLRSIRAANDLGLLTVHDQIDPGEVEYEVVDRERAKWPGWESSSGSYSRRYVQYLREEWAAAKIVLVNSQFSKNALVSQGVPGSKIITVPLSFEAPFVNVELVRKKAPLRVLWIGTVNLRKGIQYLCGAAKILLGEEIEFVVAGPSLLSAMALRQFPDNVRFVGKVSGRDKWSLYRESDVFVLPTLSDGFAITQLEALSFGLPVLATRNCGDVVQNGVNGFHLETRDKVDLAGKILRLHQDRELLHELQSGALETVNRFSLPRVRDIFEQQLIEVGEEV